MDSQSVKSTVGTGEETGYSANKKVKRRKQDVAVDTQGDVMAAGVTPAVVHDKPGSKRLEQNIEDMGSWIKIVADCAYKGVPPFTAYRRIAWKIVEKMQGNNTICLKVLPKRWTVERILACLSNFIRLSKDYEKSVLMSKAIILISAIVITLNKLCT